MTSRVNTRRAMVSSFRRLLLWYLVHDVFFNNVWVQSLRKSRWSTEIDFNGVLNFKLFVSRNPVTLIFILNLSQVRNMSLSR